MSYPLEQLQEEVAYIAYYFHWPLKDILKMEHHDRRHWAEKIASINRKMGEAEKAGAGQQGFSIKGRGVY